MLTTSDINAAICEARDYEKRAMGIRFGPDFPQLAEVLVGSEEFKSLCLNVVIGALVSGVMTKNAVVKDKSSDLIDELGDNPIVRDHVAMAFYTGFKLGRKQTQLEDLEKYER